MAGPDFQAAGDRPAVWLDDAVVDLSWAEPVDPQPMSASGGPRRRLLMIGIPVLALVVLIGSVWALGGFKDRTDEVTEIAAGKTFINGPYEFSFSRATVQETDGYGQYKRIQKVMVAGTVRNIGDEAISPNGDWFMARGRHGAHIETAQTAQLGDPDQWNAPRDVTPGLPATRISVEFEFPPTFNDKSLLMVVGHLTYGTHSYLSGDNDQYWDTGDGKAFRVELPVTRIPAEDY